MFSEFRLFVAVVVTLTAVSGCTDPPPDPIFVRGPDGDGDVDADADADADGGGQDDSGSVCTGEDYPCGPYGHGRCDVVADHSFISANEYAEDIADDDGLLDLHDLFADESITGILLFGTAGWCSACSYELEWLKDVYDDFQDVDGQGGRIEFVAVVFEGDYPGVPATARYAEAYAERGGLMFPAVADTQGDVLYYFDAQSSPGNIMIDATEMRIHRVIQGVDASGISGVLHTLDGSVTCR